MALVCSWSDVLVRYPEMDKLPNVNSTSGLTENLVSAAEAYVHGRLASRYSVPFSGNNLTAKDLMVDALYIQVNLTRQPEKTKALQDSLDTRLKALLEGSAQMITSAGAVAAVMVGDTIWSSTQNYPPAFGMSDIEKSEVSSERLYDEDVTRGEYR